MKHLAIVLAVAFSTSAHAALSAPERPIAGHPLIGKWEWTRSENKCTEVYEFRRDGSAPVQSGTEKTDNVYSVAARPDSNGFYRMTIRTTRDYGGKDCGDDESDSTGVESTNFLLFHKNGNLHLVCVEPKLEKCFGPLHRVE